MGSGFKGLRLSLITPAESPTRRLQSSIQLGKRRLHGLSLKIRFQVSGKQEPVFAEASTVKISVKKLRRTGKAKEYYLYYYAERKRTFVISGHVIKLR
jgi:hypothetical protein